MNVICLESEALYMLIDTVVDRIKDNLAVERPEIKEDKWMLLEPAMQKLGIKSKTTMQKLRDEGKIRFTQPTPKVILYDRDSLDAYLEKHAKDTF